MILLLCFLLDPAVVLGQQKSGPSPLKGLGEGLRFDAPDSSLGLRLEFRIQNQVLANTVLDPSPGLTTSPQVHALVRRARFRFKGYLLKGQFSYFGQLELDKGKSEISDAVIEWHPTDHLTFGTGQFKLFENRQNRMSSARLLFVDRSDVSRFFTQGYDIGVYWQGVWVPDQAPGIKAYAAIGHGELKNAPTAEGGFQYNGRVELLPFGAFASGGDYNDVTLTAEPSPKLSVGIAASLNRDAHTLYGEGFPDGYDSDITSLFADYIFKFRRFSFMGELLWRDVDNEVIMGPMNIIGMPVLRHISDIVAGYGLSVQGGYLLADKLELGARFEKLRPEGDSIHKRESTDLMDRYTLSLNRYIHKHNLKIQADVSLIDGVSRVADDHYRYLQTRLQFQVNF